jgi:hypothetical protein
MLVTEELFKTLLKSRGTVSWKWSYHVSDDGHDGLDPQLGGQIRPHGQKWTLFAAKKWNYLFVGAENYGLHNKEKVVYCKAYRSKLIVICWCFPIEVNRYSQYSPRRFYNRRADVVFAIYIAVVHEWSFFSDQWRLYCSVKIWHPPRTSIEKGSEQGRGRGNE